MSMSENPERLDGKIKKLITDKGRQFEADLVVCLASYLHWPVILTVS